METKFNESADLYLRLLRHVKPYWKYFAASVVALLMVAVTEPAVPALFKPLLDGHFLQEGGRQLLWIPLALIAVYVVRGAATYVADMTLTWVGARLVYDLRHIMFDRLLSLPTSTYDHYSSGKLISKVTFDVSRVTDVATDVLTVMVRDTFAILGLLAWLLYLNWRLTLVSLVVLPMIVIIIRVVNKRMRKLSRSIQRGYGDLTHVLEETTGGHKIIKIFGGQDYERKRFAKVSNRLRQNEVKSKAISALNSPLIQIVTICAVAIIVYVAAVQASAGSLTVGGFVSFLGAMGLLFAPLRRLTNVAPKLQRGLAAAESIFGLIDEQAEHETGKASLGRARGKVELRDLVFHYRGMEEAALKGISLTINPGETVALVGPSGSGKSTIANLIPRFYELKSGQILLDDQDIGDLSLAELRNNLSIVGQDVVLFNDTVAANIAYGREQEVGMQAIEEAARAAHAWDFIQELPQGLETNCGDRGVRLSGGQRQRLAIARALLKNAPVLILDEATSALDTESERNVQEALENLRRARTTLVIAHRLSTIENADRIVVLMQGRIAESGTHQELIAKGGLYAELYRVQFSETPAGQ
jgi:subfamily B ATP-binding cassette protein MsbA